MLAEEEATSVSVGAGRGLSEALAIWVRVVVRGFAAVAAVDPGPLVKDFAVLSCTSVPGTTGALVFELGSYSLLFTWYILPWTEKSESPPVLGCLVYYQKLHGMPWCVVVMMAEPASIDNERQCIHTTRLTCSCCSKCSLACLAELCCGLDDSGPSSSEANTC